MKLSKSVKKLPKYAQGGIQLAIAVSTLNEQGLPNLQITREADPDDAEAEIIKTIAVRAGATLIRLEFEDDSASYSDSTQFGTNTYPKHSIGYKFAGKSKVLDKLSKVADLTRTTHIVKTRMGECVIVGAENGLRNEKNDSGSGAAAGDLNGFDMVISGAETRKAEIITLAQFETLLAQVEGSAAPVVVPGG